MKQLSFFLGITFFILSGWSLDTGLWGLAMSFLICAIISFAIFLDP